MEVVSLALPPLADVLRDRVRSIYCKTAMWRGLQAISSRRLESAPRRTCLSPETRSWAPPDRWAVSRFLICAACPGHSAVVPAAGSQAQRCVGASNWCDLWCRFVGSSSARLCPHFLSGFTRRERSWAWTPARRTTGFVGTRRQCASSPRTGGSCTEQARGPLPGPILHAVD